MFLEEIRAMMHTFGDVKEPKEESVHLMLAILRDQMNLLLLRGAEAAAMRESTLISHEDILFVMRKSKVKLKRLLEYLRVVDMKSGFSNHLKIMEDRIVLKLKSEGKRVQKCLEFLAFIEDCDEITSVMLDESIVDISKKKRRMRTLWMTYTMNPMEYEEFLKKSQVSFYPMKRFKYWLLHDLALNLTDLAVTIIAFLARETIAEIVDMVLLLKMRKLGKIQHFQYLHFLKSDYCEKFNIETNETPEEKSSTVENKPSEEGYSTNVTTLKMSTECEMDSEDQMNESTSNYFTYEDCREKNIDALSRNKASSELNPEQSGFLFHSSPKYAQQLDEEGGTEELLLYERSDSGGIRTSGPESNKEWYEIIDDADKNNEMLPSNIFDETTSSTSLKHTLECSGVTNISEHSNVSDTDLLFSVHDNSQNLADNPMLSSEGTFVGSPVASTSALQETNSENPVEDISDTSDHDNFPEKVMSCDHKKVSKRRISVNDESKDGTQKEPILNAPEAKSLLSIAAKNEVEFITPIERCEITEAFARFQETSPLALVFATDYVPRRTKLICLIESLAIDII